MENSSSFYAFSRSAFSYFSLSSASFFRRSPKYSASWWAASLPLGSINPYKSYHIVKVSPSTSSALVPLTLAASCPTVIRVSYSILNLSINLRTQKQVMIFVRLAHSRRSLSILPNNRVFVFWSKIDHAWALQCGAGLSMRILASLISLAEIPFSCAPIRTLVSEKFAAANFFLCSICASDIIWNKFN